MDNTDTQYLGDQHWQQCWCFRFSFLFVSICLSMCQSVCVSVHLFRINLKFLKTHNYWLAQLLHVSLVSGLELKMCRMHIKMIRNSSQIPWGLALVSGFGTKQPLQQLKFLLLLWLLCQQFCDKISGKILLINPNHFSGFRFFQKKLKGKLALAYESYAGGILIVFLIEIINGYSCILY